MKYTVKIMSNEIVKDRYPDALIKLQVRSWNLRAVKCYQSVGFTVEKRETVRDYLNNETEFTFMCLDITER